MDTPNSSTTTTGATTSAIARELRAELARQQISQRFVAAQLDMSPQSIGRRLKGAHPFNTDELDKLTDILGLSLLDLVSRASGWIRGLADQMHGDQGGVVPAEYDGLLDGFGDLRGVA